MRKTCCSTDNKRMPYGQLGSVDKLTCFGCCSYFMRRAARAWCARASNIRRLLSARTVLQAQQAARRRLSPLRVGSPV